MAQGPNPVPHDPDGDAGVVCPTCGKVRPSAEVCGCGQGGGPAVPAGWDPALTRTSRPRLPLTAPATGGSSAGSGRTPAPPDQEGPARRSDAEPTPPDAGDPQT